ncbi:MAG: glycosyltransferase family 4 protein [Planctomycetes bacterium]|nr:glycosyltransferase family 4 protein [Planctomycetota bacterium]
MADAAGLQPGDDKKLTLLLIGSLPPPIGGGTVMMMHLVDGLAGRDDITLNVVNTTGVRGGALRGILRLFKVVWQISRGVRRADVVGLHVAPLGLPFIGPIVLVLCRWGGKPLILRKFGGRDYRDFGPIRRALSRWAVRNAALYLPETKALLEAAQEDGIPRVQWLPNYRPMAELEPGNPRSPRCRRFVFLSQLKVSKGIQETIAAGERLPEDALVDVYGPFCDGLTEEMFAGLKRVHYKGVVQPEDVIGILRRYDALLLPTYWVGEGYPGIVLEAFSAGLPVISTKWKSVPDLIDDTCGLLVEPRDADQLFEAMNRFVQDDELYARVCRGVPAKRARFDTKTIVRDYIGYCRTLAAAAG